MDTSHQQTFKGESKKSTGRPDGRPYSCTTITSESKSFAKTFIEYDFDENLDIKEEIIEVPETIIVQKQNKTYEPKLCTVRIREEDILAVKRKLLALKKQAIPESKQKTKYTCDKCARIYYSLQSLKNHQKYICGVTPQYSCKFCDKLFKQKGSMNYHVDRVHYMMSAKKSIAVYKCDKCWKIYNSLKNLMVHKRIDHAAVRKQFICDYCEYKGNRKGTLVSHITLRHLQVEEQLTCNYCPYKANWKSHLVKHITSCHLRSEKQFICDCCEYKSNRKGNLVSHITSRHLQASKPRHKCDKCARCFNLQSSLCRHKRLVHLGANAKYICDYCEYKSNEKGNLKRHITSRHLQTSKSIYKCDKCARCFSRLDSLSRHKRLVHSGVNEKLRCEYCEYKSNMKGNLARHITSRHLQASKSSRHKCCKCPRSYNSPQTLTRHVRVVHAAVKK